MPINEQAGLRKSLFIDRYALLKTSHKRKFETQMNVKKYLKICYLGRLCSAIVITLG